MRALWSGKPNCSHNVSQKVKRIRRLSDSNKSRKFCSAAKNWEEKFAYQYSVPLIYRDEITGANAIDYLSGLTILHVGAKQSAQ